MKFSFPWSENSSERYFAASRVHSYLSCLSSLGNCLLFMPFQVGYQCPLHYFYFPLYIFSLSLVSAIRIGYAQTYGFLHLNFYWLNVLAFFRISWLISFISIQILLDIILWNISSVFLVFLSSGPADTQDVLPQAHSPPWCHHVLAVVDPINLFLMFQPIVCISLSSSLLFCTFSREVVSPIFPGVLWNFFTVFS